MTAPAAARRGRVLLVRLDSLGDLLLTGGAVRAVAGSARSVTLLVGHGQTEAGSLLPGASEVHEFDAPWVPLEPGPVTRREIGGTIRWIRRRRFDAALIFTSFHQSPLPTALVLRLAGVPWIGAISDDYPGALLDLRHRVDDLHEAERNLSLAIAAGFIPDIEGARLAIRQPLPEPPAWIPTRRYVVVHPGATVPARRPAGIRTAALVAGLASDGWAVVVTGSPAEQELAAEAAGRVGLNAAGRLNLAALAGVLAAADVVVAPNTGPAHLAAAVGTPIVSLFAPVVPTTRWAPYGVPVVTLGDQEAACRDSRARVCPVPGHPCLDMIGADEVVAAVRTLAAPAPIPDSASSAPAPTGGL
jgi:ADP-heptose:LPS heptosyltransferase